MGMDSGRHGDRDNGHIEHRRTRRGHRAQSRTRRIVIGGGALALAGAATVAVSLASASQYSGKAAGADHAVFVQGNELDGNTIHVFKRGDDGKLARAADYATGGKGGDQVDAPPTRSPPRARSSTTTARACCWRSTPAAAR